MANLYLTIKLQGLGWEHNHPNDEDYKKLARKLARVISQDKDFLSEMRTVSIQIRGYNPLVKGLLIKKPIGLDAEVVLGESSPEGWGAE